MYEQALFKVEAVFRGGDTFKAADARLLAASHRLPGREPVLVGWAEETNRFLFPLKELDRPGSSGTEDVPTTEVFRALFRGACGRYYLVSIPTAADGLVAVEQLVSWDGLAAYAELPFKFVPPQELSED